MEQEAREDTFAEIADKSTDVLEIDLESYVNVELDMENNRDSDVEHDGICVTQGLLLTEEEEEEEDDDDDDSGTDNFNTDTLGTRLQRAERNGGENASLPDTFQTNHLLYYERFKAYQDYMLGDCKTSEVKAFTADYLEKVVEPCDWQALWSTDVFDVLVEVQDVEYKELKACVSLVLPLQCETRGCDLNEEAMRALLEATQHKVALQDLQVVYGESGDFDQTALAIEHLRFFYKHIWREWDEEDEDDDFDYFVRCVEPRLRLYYDILEDRVPAGLVAEYHSLLVRCSQCFREFSSLRNDLNSDSDSELDNVSMVEGLKLYEQMETLKRKLRIIENPLLRYVLGYKGNARQQCVQARGPRASGGRVIHVVTASTTASQLQSLLTDRLLPLCCSDETEVQFHNDPVLAVDVCFQGDVVIILPGHYYVTSSIFLPDSITIEGFGLPDEVVIEKKNKGDSFVESTGAAIKISNVKFIQHDAIEGILCVRQGKLEMENCVLQCETTGVVVRTSAHLSMNMCDLYGSKGAGVEIYPGSVCSLIGNGIHHCKEGILIKDFADELDEMPRITMENNVIHNNEGYGVILVRPSSTAEHDVDQVAQDDAGDKPAEEKKDGQTAKEKSEGEVMAGEEETAPAESLSISVDSCTSASGPLSLSSKNAAAAVTPTTSSAGTPDVCPEFKEEDGAGEHEPASSARKWRLCRQLSRNKEAGSTRSDVGLMEREIFVSVQGNQFRRNGKDNFGTFLY